MHDELRPARNAALLEVSAVVHAEHIDALACGRAVCESLKAVGWFGWTWKVSCSLFFGGNGIRIV